MKWHAPAVIRSAPFERSAARRTVRRPGLPGFCSRPFLRFGNRADDPGIAIWLRHLAEAGHPGARFAERLLAKPDRLIGLILLGNNFVNILASSLATIVAIRIGGEGAIAAVGRAADAGRADLFRGREDDGGIESERVVFPASWVHAAAAPDVPAGVAGQSDGECGCCVRFGGPR